MERIDENHELENIASIRTIIATENAGKVYCGCGNYHTFHAACLAKLCLWTETNKGPGAVHTCPVCRGEFSVIITPFGKLFSLAEISLVRWRPNVVRSRPRTYLDELRDLRRDYDDLDDVYDPYHFDDYDPDDSDDSDVSDDSDDPDDPDHSYIDDIDNPNDPDNE